MYLLTRLMLLMMVYCRHDVKSFKEMLSLFLAPLPSLNFHTPYGIIEMILPFYRGFAGCLSMLHQYPVSYPFKECLKFYTVEGFFIINKGKTKWEVVLISLLTAGLLHVSTDGGITCP